MKTFKPFAAALAAGVAVGLLAGCANEPMRAEPVATAPARVSPPPPAKTVAPAKSTAPVRHQPRVEPGVPADAITGVTACDDYLASYLGCHRVIGTYEPDALQERYDMLRASLLEEARNPEKIPGLEARCNGLAAMMKDALNGRACAGPVLTESGDTGFEDADEDEDEDEEADLEK